MLQENASTFFIFLDFFFELVYNVEKAAYLQGFSRIRRNRFFVFFCDFGFRNR